MLALIVVFIFASVALFSGVLLYPYLSRRNIVRDRVTKLMMPPEEQARIVPVQTKWQRFLHDFGARLRTSSTDLRTYREMLTSAGFRPDSVYIFLGCKLILTIALPIIFLVLAAIWRSKITGTGTIMTALACAFCGFLLPSYWLDRRADERKTEIFHALPDVLDLLTVCVEAGLSLNAALIKTAENFQHKNNPLICEIHTVTQEIRIGKSRTEALKSLAERTKLDDMKAFVAMLIQTEKFGTSLGKTLRTYSDSLRMKRKQLAEEKAGKTPVKMLFPLTFFVFPALMVVILTPAFFKIAGVLAKMPKHH